MRSDSGKQTERRREFLQKVGRGAAGAAVVTASLATAKPGRAGVGGVYNGRVTRNERFREAWENRHA